MRSFENPLATAPAAPRSKKTSELVRLFLGNEARAEFENVIGKEEESVHVEEDEDSVTPSDEELENDLKAAREQPWSRERIIRWAKECGFDEKWVNENIEFHPDGSFDMKGTVVFSVMNPLPDGSLPKGLKKVKGQLVFSHSKLEAIPQNFPLMIEGWLGMNGNQLTSLEGMSSIVTGPVLLDSNQIESLEGMTQEIGGYLQLSYNSLENVKGIAQKIGGDIMLFNNPLISLEGLPPPDQIGGAIVLDSRQEKRFGNELREKGYRVMLN